MFLRYRYFDYEMRSNEHVADDARTYEKVVARWREEGWERFPLTADGEDEEALRLIPKKRALETIQERLSGSDRDQDDPALEPP